MLAEVSITSTMSEWRLASSQRSRIKLATEDVGVLRRTGSALRRRPDLSSQRSLSGIGSSARSGAEPVFQHRDLLRTGE